MKGVMMRVGRKFEKYINAIAKEKGKPRTVCSDELIEQLKLRKNK
jgi:hypothetical protein